MSDLIRMAKAAHHYLALFDGAKPWHYVTKRFNLPARRNHVVLKGRGCSGRLTPGFYSGRHVA